MQRIHLSVDDSLSVFRELTENADKCGSAFCCPRLAYYKALHEKYGAKITLYCFARDGVFDIGNSTGKFANELSENASWLRFGFHSADPDANMLIAPFEESAEAYKYVTRELKRITGGAPTSALRLHYFAASTRLRRFLAENGVKALLGADDDRVSYSLAPETDAKLKRCGQCRDTETGLHIYRTMARLEKCADVSAALSEARNAYPEAPLVVFTHDRLPQGIARMEETARFGMENGLEFGLEDE
ncbi:MAG: hypothetical protein PHI27_02040 [Eubacteriales bacterium]|nr:hypothetical protein [Eubacteriales bacterium]MDD3881013.1 hypothetical protein [Eubacteriales bacterium]MDD4511918.1 hypothetical protein [Eubacteriales bacterium]